MLAALPFFARIDRDAQLAIAEHCAITTYRAGATLMRQDEIGNFACVLLEGEIDIYVEIPAGRIHIAAMTRR